MSALRYDLRARNEPLARSCAALGRGYVGAELDPGRHAEALALLSRVD